METKRTYDRNRYLANREKVLADGKIYREKNRDKIAARARKYRESNPEKVRESVRKSAIKYRYGITAEEYEAMLVDQDGLCAICDKPETRCDRKTGQPLRLVIDHCHATGRVRALLCSRCNVALGMANDEVETLLEMANYVRRYSGMVPEDEL